MWTFFAEHYKVTSLDELFRERTGAKAVVGACFATSTVLLTAPYSTRNAEFPRGFFALSVAVLLILAVILRALFRVLSAAGFDSSLRTHLLIIGTGRFARDAASRLQRLSFAPCSVAAFVHLPGQEVAVENCTLLELEELCAPATTQSVMQSVDEAVKLRKPFRINTHAKTRGRRARRGSPLPDIQSIHFPAFLLIFRASPLLTSLPPYVLTSLRLA